MSLSSFELVFLTVSLLLPGYTINLILRSRRIRKSEKSQVAFFRWLVLGTIAELPWIIIGFLILSPHWVTDRGVWNYVVDSRYFATLAWLLAVFVWPFVVGWALGEAEAIHLQRGQGTWPRLLASIGRMVLAQSPINDDSSWDTKFTSLEGTEGQWVLIELMNGEWIAGIFGSGSDASVDPTERDLYIADVRYTSIAERFPGLESPGGILIPAGQIRIIHFWE